MTERQGMVEALHYFDTNCGVRRYTICILAQVHRLVHRRKVLWVVVRGEEEEGAPNAHMIP